jgi:peptide/nickel transport system substrate-binding protein
MAIDSDLSRRRFLRASGVGAAVGATMLAGCAGDDGNGDGESGGLGEELEVEDEEFEPSDPSEIEEGGTLIVSLTSNPSTLNPQLGHESATRHIFDQVTARLLRADESGELYPDLAEDWEVSDDADEYVFTLREGVEFHSDYGEVDAEEVVENFHNMMLDEEYGAIAASDFEGVLFDVEDGDVTEHPEEHVYASGEYEVTFDLMHPSASFPFDLADYRASIIPMEALEEYGDDFGSTETGIWGAGPFQYVEGQDESYFELEANPDYYGETDAGQLPYLDGIRFEVIAESSVRNTQVQTGEIHIDQNVLASDVESLTDEDGVTVRSHPGSEQLNIYVNKRNFEPFSDERVRQAISHGVNREAIVQVQYDGLAEPNYGIFPEWHWAYDEDAVTKYDHDPARAEELLEEAGHAELEFTARVPNESPFSDHAEIIQQNLAEIGVDMEIDTVEESASWDPFLPGAWDNDPVGPPEEENALIQSIGYHFDADNYAGDTYETEAQFNSSFYSDEEVDELLRSARQTGDQDEQIELYAQVQEIVTAEIPQVYTVWENHTHAFTDGVEDYVPRSNGLPPLEEVWLSDE